MHRDILRWASQCESCATSKVARHTSPLVLAIPVPKERFSHVHVDIVGPFSPDQGNRYILTMVDRTTRWPEAAPIPDITAETVLQAFMAIWVARYGVPQTVTSDRGVQFSSTVWRMAMQHLGIGVSSTTSYHPQSNRLVERFHWTLKDALRCAVKASKSWNRSLPWVFLGIRNAPKLDTSTSTAEVLFGVPLRIPGICFRGERDSQLSAAEQLRLSSSNAADFTPETLDTRRFWASPFVAKSLRIAKFVYVRDDRLGKTSLAPRYTGPFKVLEKDWGNNVFRIDLGKKMDNISIARLKAASIPEEAT